MTDLRKTETGSFFTSIAVGDGNIDFFTFPFILKEIN